MGEGGLPTTNFFTLAKGSRADRVGERERGGGGRGRGAETLVRRNEGGLPIQEIFEQEVGK